MKIESNLLNISMPQSDRVQEASKPEGRSAARAQPLQAGGDGVDLGSQAGLIAAAQTAGQATRANVVQNLRSLIQSGQYQVDNAALSDSMVSAAQSGS